jgi:hypothetical protein
LIKLKVEINFSQVIQELPHSALTLPHQIPDMRWTSCSQKGKGIPLLEEQSIPLTPGFKKKAGQNAVIM